MSRFALCLTTLLVAAVPVAAQQFTPRIPASAAIAQCKVLDGPSAEANAAYRNCVAARSGERLPEPERDFTITISGTARLGIVWSSD